MVAKAARKTTSAKAKTNGSESTKKKGAASSAKAAETKKPAKNKHKEPTLEEVTMAAWEYTYKNRHKRIKVW